MIPKISRIEDPDTILFVRDERDGVCLYGLFHGEPCSYGKDVHHIVSKGAGGSDVPENLITLCRLHHNLAQENKISKEALRRILEFYFEYTYEEAP